MHILSCCRCNTSHTMSSNPVPEELPDQRGGVWNLLFRIINTIHSNNQFHNASSS